MGGRLPDNAWRLDWFLAIPRNANKDTGIGMARAAMRGCGQRPCSEPPPACRGFEAAPGPAEKSIFCQCVSREQHRPRRRFAQIAARPMNLTAG